MKRVFGMLMLVWLAGAAPAQTAPQPKQGPPPPPPTMAKVLENSIKNAAGEVVPAAEAMPADKWDFAPTNGEFKGVRTFALEVKHIAATNWDIGGAILGEKPPVETGDNGPDSMKSREDVLKYLKDSYAYVLKAVNTITPDNATTWINGPWGGRTTRLSMGTLAFGHSFDHYGQMVEYLRMNNVIPPASRNQPPANPAAK